MFFGQISGLIVHDGEPVLDPPPLVLVEVKLDLHEESSGLVGLPDFELGREILRLMLWLDEIRNGTIRDAEVGAAHHRGQMEVYLRDKGIEPSRPERIGSALLGVREYGFG